MNDQYPEYRLKLTSQFKKDYKLSIKRNYDIESLNNVIRMIAKRIPLPPEYKDHELSGNWKNHRECHIKNELAFNLSDKG